MPSTHLWPSDKLHQSSIQSKILFTKLENEAILAVSAMNKVLTISLQKYIGAMPSQVTIYKENQTKKCTNAYSFYIDWWKLISLLHCITYNFPLSKVYPLIQLTRYTILCRYSFEVLAIPLVYSIIQGTFTKTINYIVVQFSCFQLVLIIIGYLKNNRVGCVRRVLLFLEKYQYLHNIHANGAKLTNIIVVWCW